MDPRLASLAPRLLTGAPLAAERTVPVHPALAGVLPQGLPRGATVVTRGDAAVSLALVLAAGAVQAGSWLGVAGVPGLGVQAAVEAGLTPSRMVVVGEAAGRGDDTWGQVLGALIDGFDVVVLGGADRVRAGTARRVQSRLAHRGVVLVLVGAPGPFSCELELSGRPRWEGLGHGHGHLRARQVELALAGRRIPNVRRDAIWLPGRAGEVARVAPTAPTVPAGLPAAQVRPLQPTG
jgi:hypothetical protein